VHSRSADEFGTAAQPASPDRLDERT
jgi:hypothetical protein